MSDDANGCTTTALSNGVVHAIPSGGNDAVCTSDQTSEVRFYMGGGK